MRIAQISDLHLTPDGSLLYGSVNTWAAFASVLLRLATLEPRPDFLMVTGDLAEGGDAATYRRLADRLGEVGIPFAVIPGNHDAEVQRGHQRMSLVEFIANFCQARAGIPEDAGTVVREMSAQPGVYWWLKAPFADVIGLYSNAGESQGAIRGRTPGEEQFTWFQSALQRIAQARQNGWAAGHPPCMAARVAWSSAR